MSFTNSNMKIVDSNLVEKILEQGQKLRNAMIGSILKNDPFSTEILINNHYNTPRSSRSELSNNTKTENVIPLNDKRLEAFIKGDCMSKEEEKLALDTLRSLSAPDLCETTERTLKSTNIGGCKCYICKVYNSKYLSCDSKLNSQKEMEFQSPPQHEVTENIPGKYKAYGVQTLKFVDSLKIAINSLILNDIGNQKILSTVNSKVPCKSSSNFFLEYKVPEILVTSAKHKSKVDSGLETNHVRLSSRKTSNVINFKQVTIHDIKSLDKVDLENCEIDFKVSFRNCKQKSSVVLGCAKFDLKEFLLTKNLSCSRGLVVFLNENSPIAVGVLKLSLQLGCGRLYFGQEFIEAVTSSNKETVLLDSDDSTNHLLNGSFGHSKPEPEKNIRSFGKHTDYSSSNSSKHTSKENTSRRPDHGSLPSCVLERKPPNSIQVETTERNSPKRVLASEKKVSAEIAETQKSQEVDRYVLFSFFYVSEAQYLSGPVSSFITCRPFSQTETSVSQVVVNTSNPTFNFHQVIPLVFDNELLLSLRENYMIIEFWQKTDSANTIIGISKVPLHQFYLAYRNSVLLKYLIKNKLPVIGTDWWQPIFSPDNDELRGQVQLLTAVGTEEQINNLKSDRGFPSNFVKANFPDPKLDSKSVNRPKSYFDKPIARPSTTFKKSERFLPVYKEKSTNTCVERTKKSDAATQSYDNMDRGVPNLSNSASNMMGSIFEELMRVRQRNVCVENSTNTEAVREVDKSNSQLEEAQSKTNVGLKKTSDLLDSLQKALSLDNGTKPANSSPESFKATIGINSANHLPSRKKCKSRKSRSRCSKNEDSILPSCYVSFETISDQGIKVTPTVPNSTSPTWNFKQDVLLPVDLLTNSQKRLIFKVWRRNYNTASSPNMQVDTVLGFAAVDLTVLLSGFSNVQGWFNIVDFSGKCHGQINIHVTPLDDLTKYKTIKTRYLDLEFVPDNFESVAEALFPDEPPESLSRVLKRKFTELDEITQRLRSRLSTVTNDDSDSSNGFTDEFERDINTLCVEEDFDLVDFEEEARKLSLGRDVGETSEGKGPEGDLSSLLKAAGHNDEDSLMEMENDKGAESNCSLESACGMSTEESVGGQSVKEDGEPSKEISLDRQLIEGKKHINTLLEKLTLLSVDVNNTFSNRYVSGCSFSKENSGTNIDTEAILKELDCSSRPNIQSSLGFNPVKFQQLYAESAYIETTDSPKTETPLTATSDTSLITDFSDCRPAPDGQGNTSDEKILKSTE